MAHEDPGIAEIHGSDNSGIIRRVYIGEKMEHWSIVQSKIHDLVDIQGNRVAKACFLSP